MDTNKTLTFGTWDKTFCFGAICAVLTAVTTPVGASGEIQVSASLQKTSEGKHQIEFVVTNPSPKALRIVKDDLPWGNPYSTLILICTRQGVIETPKLLIQANPNEKLTLPAGASVSGRLSLESLVPDFETQASRRELIVFWSYRPGVSIESALGPQSRFGGWFSVAGYKQ